MIDNAVIVSIVVAIFFVIYRAIKLDSLEPWFGSPPEPKVPPQTDVRPPRRSWQTRR